MVVADAVVVYVVVIVNVVFVDNVIHGIVVVAVDVFGGF